MVLSARMPRGENSIHFLSIYMYLPSQKSALCCVKEISLLPSFCRDFRSRWHSFSGIFLPEAWPVLSSTEMNVLLNNPSYQLSPTLPMKAVRELYALP